MPPVWISFGISAIIVLMVALASRNITFGKLAAILFASWVTSRIADMLFGYHMGPRMFVVFDATFGLWVLAISLRSRSFVAAAIFAIFLTMCIWHAEAFALGMQGSRRYFVVLNVLFGMQLLMVGGSTVVEVARERLARPFPVPAVRGTRGTRGVHPLGG